MHHLIYQGSLAHVIAIIPHIIAVITKITYNNRVTDIYMKSIVLCHYLELTCCLYTNSTTANYAYTDGT